MITIKKFLKTCNEFSELVSLVGLTFVSMIIFWPMAVIALETVLAWSCFPLPKYPDRTLTANPMRHRHRCPKGVVCRYGSTPKELTWEHL